MKIKISQDENERLIEGLADLKQVHRELDIAIEQLVEQCNANQFEVSRLKKQKLKLKDAISRLESKLIPDLHA